MKYYGCQKLDHSGRVLLPDCLRKQWMLLEADELEIYATDSEIILRKAIDRCILCGGIEDVLAYRNKKICKPCMLAIKSQTV